MSRLLALNKSRLRSRLLSYFFTNPEASLYLREIAVILGEDVGNLSKELTRLEKEGIFVSTKRGKQRFFALKKEYPLYKELEAIIFKTVGVKGAILEALKNIEGIKFAFIYGSFAKSEQTALSDIDLAIIGKINENEFVTRITGLERLLNREIEYILYSEQEWQEKKLKKGEFANTLIQGPKIMLIGTEDGL